MKYQNLIIDDHVYIFPFKEIYLYHGTYHSILIMASKNTIVKCSACGAVWLSQAQRPRCAVRTCRSTAVQRLTVAEVEDLVDHLLECLNEVDNDTHYHVTLDSEHEELAADLDLNEFVAEALDEQEEPEEPEKPNEHKSPRLKALAVVRKEIACKEAMLTLLLHDAFCDAEREQLEAELDVLERRLTALRFARDAPADDDDAEEEES